MFCLATVMFSSYPLVISQFYATKNPAPAVIFTNALVVDPFKTKNKKTCVTHVLPLFCVWMPSWLVAKVDVTHVLHQLPALSG